MNLFEVIGGVAYSAIFWTSPVLLLLLPFIGMLNSTLYRECSVYSNAIRSWWNHGDGVIHMLLILCFYLMCWVPFAHIHKVYGYELRHLSLIEYVYEVGTRGWVFWLILLLLFILFILPTILGKAIAKIINIIQKSRRK